jgi:hypothetical protein
VFGVLQNINYDILPEFVDSYFCYFKFNGIVEKFSAEITHSEHVSGL